MWIHTSQAFILDDAFFDMMQGSIFSKKGWD
jgi:hypothetical protein